MTSPLAVSHPWDLVSSGYLRYNLAHFERFAARALELARVEGGHRVIDVATGPGTLAALAAQRGAQVSALDFSPQMIELCSQRIAALGLTAVEARVGDGQQLPFADETFDAGFSMFGLMFFPDRAQGFRELHRVLRPGAIAVVSSWLPMNDIPVLAALFAGVYAAAPELKSNAPAVPPALSSPEAIQQEMSSAGFDVTIEQVTYVAVAPSAKEFMDAARSSFAPICLMQEQLGAERFAQVWRAATQHVEQELGAGPVEYPLRALLGVGRRRVGKTT